MTARSITDYELRSAIAATAARPARAFELPPERKPQPAYVPLPVPSGTRWCDPCGLTMTEVDNVYVCGCGFRERLYSTTKEPGFGWVRTYLVMARKDVSK